MKTFEKEIEEIIALIKKCDCNPTYESTINYEELRKELESFLTKFDKDSMQYARENLDY